jgi:hypothetical protein
MVCRGTAAYSAIGPHQGKKNGGALRKLGVLPNNRTVAIGDPGKIFGIGSRRTLARIAPDISIEPSGLDDRLDQHGGPRPPYSIGDVGDRNIRNSPVTRFDIYRFRDLRQARAFDRPLADTTITLPNVYGAHCPPDFRRVR